MNISSMKKFKKFQYYQSHVSCILTGMNIKSFYLCDSPFQFLKTLFWKCSECSPNSNWIWNNIVCSTPLELPNRYYLEMQAYASEKQSS